MLITVKDVLELDGFINAKVVAGEKGLSNTVSNAALMEVPDILPFVKANNLLITTLFPIYDDEDTINNLIPQIEKLNLAGICIKPARYVEEIPSIMIEQADALNFPIIELPTNVNFSELISEIIELSLDKHIEVLNFRNYIHQHLMNLFLKGADIGTLVNSLAKLVKFPIILLDNELNIDLVSEDITDKEVSLIPSKSEYTNNHFIIRINDVDYSEQAYIKHLINAGQRKFGYLLLLKGDSKDKNMLIAVEQASLLIASVFFKNDAVIEKEKTFQDSFIRDILNGKKYSQIETINKARSFGWSLEFPQVLMNIKVWLEDEQKKKEAYDYILNSNLIEKALEQLSLLTGDKFKSVFLDDSLVLFINVAFVNQIKKKVTEAGYLINENLKNKFRIGIGISNSIVDVNQFPSAYQEAQNALYIGSYIEPVPFVSHYDNYQLFNVIKEVQNTDILQKYVDNKLGEIIAYDKKANMNLIKTLIILIEENFNAKKAANKLFIHYNTLRYRMETIKKLGIDINNGLEIAEITFAYNVHLWLKANKLSN
ncbi:PucR family transcriptional regulator [Amphibacillus sp. Q70]|uniref:PucR family transcriptional regulator n=1 Tax=Amphibacillus sp. Q70 TaxID=3453416 RepID=UPI003F851746